MAWMWRSVIGRIQSSCVSGEEELVGDGWGIYWGLSEGQGVCFVKGYLLLLLLQCALNHKSTHISK